MNECIIPTTNNNNTCKSTQTTTTFYKDELCKQFLFWLFLFIYLGLPVLNRVSATVYGTTTWALNSTSPHERWTTTLGTMSPPLHEQCIGSLMSHRIYMCKGCEMGPMVYHPCLRRIESLTVCRCIYKGSSFSSVIKRPWVFHWCGWGLNKQPPAQQASAYPIELTRWRLK